MSNKNTYQRGRLTFYFYPTSENTFVAACEELCLVKEGEDAEYTRFSILSAAKSYLTNVCKHKLGEHLLNQTLPDEIKKEFNKYRSKIKNEKFEKWTVSLDDIKKLSLMLNNQELIEWIG